MAITLDLKKAKQVVSILRDLSDVNTPVILRLHNENPDLTAPQIAVKIGARIGTVKRCQEALEVIGVLECVTQSGQSLYEVNGKKLVEFQKYLKKFPRKDPKQLTLILK